MSCRVATRVVAGALAAVAVGSLGAPAQAGAAGPEATRPQVPPVPCVVESPLALSVNALSLDLHLPLFRDLRVPVSPDATCASRPMLRVSVEVLGLSLQALLHSTDLTASVPSHPMPVLPPLGLPATPGDQAGTAAEAAGSTVTTRRPAARPTTTIPSALSEEAALAPAAPAAAVPEPIAAVPGATPTSPGSASRPDRPSRPLVLDEADETQTDELALNALPATHSRQARGISSRVTTVAALGLLAAAATSVQGERVYRIRRRRVN